MKVFSKKIVPKKIQHDPLRPPPQNGIYPPYNFEELEEYIYKNFRKSENDRYEYLPVYFNSITNLILNRNQFDTRINEYLSSLDRTKKYWTINQHDYGNEPIQPYIEDSIKDLDIRFFFSSKNNGIPIPLLSSHNIGSGKDWNQRTWFMSFMGVIKNRHPIREKIKSVLDNKSQVFISESLLYENFVETMKDTKFALCPRGNGATSFRIQEALQAGCIPVYISDEFILPFHQKYIEYIPFTDYGVLIKSDEIENMEKILKDLSEEKIQIMREMGSIVLNKYYSYEGCLEMISKIIRVE